MADNGAPIDAQSLVLSSSPQNHCRRRKSEEDSSSKPSLSDLEEDLLMEILQRLPAAKDAYLCSSVCKNWYGIIFRPQFISQFVTYHANHVANKNHSSCNLGGFENSISVVVMDRNSRHRAIMLPLNPHSKIQPLSLRSFCPKSKWTCTLASCHDLLLCVASMKVIEVGLYQKEEFMFYICNPLTMQAIRVCVPQWEERFSCSSDCSSDSPFAFVSEPYCSRDSQGGCVLNAGFRYRMLWVRADKSSKAGYLPIEIYCSERGKSTEDGFIEDSLFGEEFQKEICSNVVVYNGKVHWCNGESIVAYDPFRIGDLEEDDTEDDTEDDDIEEDDTEDDDLEEDDTEDDDKEEDATEDNTFIIKCPDYVRDMSYACPSYKLGVCRGHLRLMYLEEETSMWSLRVWDLEDYEKGKWSVERKFCVCSLIFSLVSDDHPLYEKLVDCFNDGNFTVVAPHPCDEDAVYFSFDGMTILLNMERKELNVLGEFRDARFGDRSDTECETRGNPILIPWWPTPLGNSLPRDTNVTHEDEDIAEIGGEDHAPRERGLLLCRGRTHRSVTWAKGLAEGGRNKA